MQSQNLPTIALLTAGRDKPYALGLAAALVDAGITLEFLGSDDVGSPMLHESPQVTFLNMRGDQAVEAPLSAKLTRVLRYYARLIAYAVYAKPRIFHILWNNKFEWFDRTFLMLWYRVCGRRIVFTAHNVNAGTRDNRDSVLNRATLSIQYALADFILVHTELMRRQLHANFRVPLQKIGLIPFGMNSTVSDTPLTREEARSHLGLRSNDRVLLFFGNIAPYKGLEYLVEAMTLLPRTDTPCRLLIVGRPKGDAGYWERTNRRIADAGLDCCISARIEYIPDEETEIYFKAADALVLPYTFVFQSGVLFLGYNFGLPVLAADVGSLKEDIVDGKTGMVFRPADQKDLARVIQRYFESDLYRELSVRRKSIRAFAQERYSWSRVASITEQVYAQLLKLNSESVESLQASDLRPPDAL